MRFVGFLFFLAPPLGDDLKNARGFSDVFVVLMGDGESGVSDNVTGLGLGLVGAAGGFSGGGGGAVTATGVAATTTGDESDTVGGVSATSDSTGTGVFVAFVVTAEEDPLR